MNATSNRYQVSIEADPSLPIIRMTRDFDATPAQLMRAHTDPDLFARWVGPNRMQTEVLDWDATTGGRWRYVAAGGLLGAVTGSGTAVTGIPRRPRQRSASGLVSANKCRPGPK